VLWLLLGRIGARGGGEKDGEGKKDGIMQETRLFIDCDSACAAPTTEVFKLCGKNTKNHLIFKNRQNTAEKF